MSDNTLTSSEIAQLQAMGCETGPGQKSIRTSADTDLPSEAFPANDPGYAARMIAKAEGAAPRPRSASSNDVGRLPAATGVLEGWSPFGSPRGASQLKPGDTFTWNGTKVEVEQGCTLGLIERDAAGGYKCLSSSDQAAIAAQEKRAATEQSAADTREMAMARETGEEVDAATQATINDFMRRGDGAAVDGLLQEAINTGDVTTINLARAGQALGYTASQTTNVFNQAWDGYLRQANTVAMRAGVPAASLGHLWDFAAETDPTAHRFAINAMVRASDTAGIKAIAKRYVDHLRRSVTP